MELPDCVIEPPHIVADPCKPRWVVKCEHGEWHWATFSGWTDKRDERGAFLGLMNLRSKLFIHVLKMRNE